VLKNPEDRTQISLLYANQTSDDILLRQQLDALAEKHDNFRVWHTSEPLLPAASGYANCRAYVPLSRLVPEHIAVSGRYVALADGH
jgi:ferredoxin-NADP reductase